MSRGKEGGKSKPSGRSGGKSSAGAKGGNRRNAGSQDHKGKSSARGNSPTEKRNTRGGKNQIIGTSRSGKPVTKKEYIERKKAESSPKKKKKDDGMRLNKYIANSGLCSRRDADIYIKAGSVTVNGKPVTEMGFKVQPGDEVRFDNRPIEPKKKEYFLLNKPKGFISPRKGELASKTVMDLMANASPNNLHFVGRLSRASLGLMLFTSDLEMANKLNNPKHELRQMYHVALDRSFKHEDLVRLRQGIVIDREQVNIKEVNYVENGRNNEIGIELFSGKDNIVPRIFESIGYEIKILDRVMLADLTKKDLPRGHYRKLTDQEVINLKMRK
ncbi:pseudouridine synthase [Nonlabens xiamenensis]|uniref:pseudouridine synthase n=1 Tax=Nonlabens xiamenensis TaxID=2341043 RepID=UPI000F6130F1|nr:pseudouridine synthase [Nonlabens xiamenensis]